MYRNYTLPTIEDEIHVSNGRCPTYALFWGEPNNKHWPEGHDYFIGNGININDGSRDLREILKKSLTKKLVFCDLDGVLADFEEGVKNKFKKSVDELNDRLMWGVINKSKTFFETLPWMPKGKELWNAIREYDPIILTGIPYGNKTAAEQKRRWCAKHLGPNVKIICCYSKDKPKYCLNDSILIDDRPNIANEWNEKGGEFVLYSEDNLDDILERIKNSNIM